MTQAQGCVLIPLCNHHPGHSNDVGTTKRLLRGVVPTQDRSALKTSSQTGCIRLGWQLAAERPAFRWSRAVLWAWLDLNWDLILISGHGPGGPLRRMKMWLGRPVTSALPGAAEPDYQWDAGASGTPDCCCEHAT